MLLCGDGHLGGVATDKLVEVTYVEFLGDRYFLVINRGYAPVAICFYDSCPGLLAAVECQQVQFALGQGAAGRLLGLDKHIIVQFIDQGLQM